MRQVVLIVVGVLVGVGLTLMTDPRFDEKRGDVLSALPEWVSGNGFAHSR